MRKTKKQFWMTTLLVVLVIIGVYFFGVTKPKIEKQQADQEIKLETQLAISTIDSIYKQYEKGQLGYGEAYEKAAKELRLRTYGGGGYFFADTEEGINIVLYGDKKVEGKYRMEDTINGVAYVKELNKKAMSGGGYVDYWYPKQGGGEPVAKRAYAEYYEPFGWVVGTGYYLEDI